MVQTVMRWVTVTSSKVVNSVLGSASFGYKRKFFVDCDGPQRLELYAS